MEGLVERACVWLDDDDDDDAAVAPVGLHCRIFAGMQLTCSSSCMLAGNPPMDPLSLWVNAWSARSSKSSLEASLILMMDEGTSHDGKDWIWRGVALSRDLSILKCRNVPVLSPKSFPHRMSVQKCPCPFLFYFTVRNSQFSVFYEFKRTQLYF